MTRITQGNFALLPDLSDQQIKRQIEYALKKGYAISIEYTDDIHPRNCYWEMWKLPLFDVKSALQIFTEFDNCRSFNMNHYIKINAFNNERGVESTAISFIAHRPPSEPGFYLVRQEGQGRNIRYTLQGYALAKQPYDRRYPLPGFKNQNQE